MDDGVWSARRACMRVLRWEYCVRVVAFMTPNQVSVPVFVTSLTAADPLSLLLASEHLTRPPVLPACRCRSGPMARSEALSVSSSAVSCIFTSTSSGIVTAANEKI